MFFRFKSFSSTDVVIYKPELYEDHILKYSQQETKAKYAKTHWSLLQSHSPETNISLRSQITMQWW